MLNKYNEMSVGRTSDGTAKGEGWMLTDVMTETVSWTDVQNGDGAEKLGTCVTGHKRHLSSWICARMNLAQCAFRPL